MKITYDPEADAMSIKLKEGTIDHTKEIDANTIADYDKDNNVIAVELLFVSERVPSPLKNIQIENLAKAAS